MDEAERQELVTSIMEVKKLVDEVLPLESSILRDQILAMVVVSLIQAKLMAKFAPQTVATAQVDLNSVVRQLGQLFVKYERLEREKTATALTQVAAHKGKEWAWKTHEDFMKRLGNVGSAIAPTGQKEGAEEALPGQ